MRLRGERRRSEGRWAETEIGSEDNHGLRQRTHECRDLKERKH